MLVSSLYEPWFVGFCRVLYLQGPPSEAGGRSWSKSQVARDVKRFADHRTVSKTQERSARGMRREKGGAYPWRASRLHAGHEPCAPDQSTCRRIGDETSPRAGIERYLGYRASAWLSNPNK